MFVPLMENDHSCQEKVEFLHNLTVSRSLASLTLFYRYNNFLLTPRYQIIINFM